MAIITENGDAKRRYINLLTAIVNLPPSEHYTVEVRSQGSIPLILISPHGSCLMLFSQAGQYAVATTIITDNNRSGELMFDVKPKARSVNDHDKLGVSYLQSILKEYPEGTSIPGILTRISVVNMVDQLMQDLLKRTPIRSKI